MHVSLNITTLTQSVRIALRSSLKQTQRSQPQGEVGRVSRSHNMFFSKRLLCVRLWLLCLSLAILGFSHLSAAAACLSPDPYLVNSNTSLNLVQDGGCTLGSFTVGAGITLQSGVPNPPIIDNYGTITTITNNGIISGNELITNRGNITTIINTATMSSTIAAIRNQGGVISLINNSGAISSNSNEPAVRNTGSIIELINTGTIVGTSAGIQNSGVITTLHNQQGTNGTNPLTYSGVLPAKYRILIAGTTTFGRLSSAGVTGATEFGVSRFSTTSPSIINMTFANVLVGITPANLGLGLATTLSDVSNGYSYTLTQTDSSTNSWSLTITACRDCVSSGSGGTSVSNISSGTSVGLASIGANPVLSGGTLVLLSGDSSSTAFSVTSASTIQNPTSGSATLSGVFSGGGGLTFIGTGSTIMSGANTYSGGTTVSGGTLEVAGPSPTGTGDVFVASAGTLMGTGTIAGNSIVSGVLKPGNSPGYLSFTQSLTLNAGSTYQQDIAGSVQASSASPWGLQAITHL
jgi:autotransporter-associated beta strand protein